MLLMSAGARESLRFLPALTINESELAQALQIFEESLTEAVAAARTPKP
jgi:4-aminobutyrate aminotransferase-like enzyme